MKINSEKEKKLVSALDKLKNLQIQNPSSKDELKNLSLQKNQLEIEKKEIEDKYQSLINDHGVLSQKLKELNNKSLKKRIIIKKLNSPYFTNNVK